VLAILEISLLMRRERAACGACDRSAEAFGAGQSKDAHWRNLHSPYVSYRIIERWLRTAP
jgi:hypothetical protein